MPLTVRKAIAFNYVMIMKIHLSKKDSLEKILLSLWVLFIISSRLFSKKYKI